MSLENIRAAFDIGMAREELSGSPFASARNMASNAALAFGGQSDPDESIRLFIDSATRLHGEAIAALTEARDATETSHRQAQAIRSLNADAEAMQSELAEAREALAEWRGKARAYQEQRDSQARRADRWQRVAEDAESDANRIARQRDAESNRAVKAERRLERIAGELRGITLGQLARMGSYGASLAAAFMESE